MAKDVDRRLIPLQVFLKTVDIFPQVFGSHRGIFDKRHSFFFPPDARQQAEARLEALATACRQLRDRGPEVLITADRERLDRGGHKCLPRAEMVQVGTTRHPCPLRNARGGG